MKKFYILALFSLSTFFFAQKVETLFDDEKFAELVALEKENSGFTDRELYYLGYAFFREENDDKAIEFYDKAIKKGFNNPIIFFQKGLSEMYLKKYDEALVNFNKAISKAPTAEFYIEKARIYHIKGDYANEEKVYVEGLEKSTIKDSKWYLELLKNAGNFYYAQTKEFSKSEKVYIDGIEKFPKEYILYEKLIKALNAQDKFLEGNKIFDQLKAFYSHKVLSEDYMEFKNVAVDEFSWNGQWINIYKSFEKPKKTLESLYKVYLIDKNGEKVERKFNIEKTLQIEKNDAEFVICEESKEGHTTYPVGFKDDTFTIKSLRDMIIKILESKNK
ncbi:Tetratricopeptide repeat-containing protein [Chryseobacterium polytrichastri]|uniref:Tetratricopeptide repeat-containing protein n=1 Tax=Chryseobacterium polytrichastri TaxID=1302687 RepID=A0A1M7BQ58_9FLAO|nr:Tetratricopeptide repeat-containing protein [Chryseobacterium polytrichastri]